MHLTSILTFAIGCACCCTPQVVCRLGFFGSQSGSSTACLHGCGTPQRPASSAACPRRNLRMLTRSVFACTSRALAAELGSSAQWSSLRRMPAAGESASSTPFCPLPDQSSSAPLAFTVNSWGSVLFSLLPLDPAPEPSLSLLPRESCGCVSLSPGHADTLKTASDTMSSWLVRARLSALPSNSAMAACPVFCSVVLACADFVLDRRGVLCVVPYT